MIKINLASRKQAALSMDSLSKMDAASILKSVDLSVLKELPLQKVLLPVVLGFTASYSLDFYKEGELAKASELLRKVNGENTKLQADLAGFKSYESIKTSMDQDEVMIKSKLETVQKLMSDRAVPLKIILSLSNSIPKEVWLTEIKMAASDMSLFGSSVGFTPISDFMKALREVAYFQSIDLVDTRQQGQEKTTNELANFELKIKRR